MNIVQYNEREHYEILTSWWRGHGKSPPPADVLSATGLVVPGICAGFLYLTNSRIGLLDYLISNPDFRDKRVKCEALDDVTEAIIKLGGRLGLKRLTAHTVIPQVSRRGLRLGASLKTVTLLEKRYG